MLKKTFPYLLILMFLLVLIGCNGSQITSPDTTPDNTPNQEITLEEEESIEISATEDTKISLQDGLEVEIKGNTLNGDTTLYIAKVALSKARANANLALLSLYEVAFIGDDISLNDAVTLKFPVPSGLTEDEIIIGHFHGNQTDMIEGYLSSGKYVIEVSEFSKFGVYSKDTTDEVSTQDLNDETSDYLSASWWPAPEPPVFTTQSGSWFDCDEEYRIEWEDSFWKPVIKYDIQAYYGSFDENENPDKKDDTWSGYYDFYYSPDPDDPHAMGSKHIYYRIRSRNTLTQAESDWTDPIEIHLDDEPPPNLTISDHEVEIGEKYSLNWNVPSCTARYEIWEISKLNNGDISTDYIEVDSKGEVILDDYDSTVAGTIIYAIQFYNDGMTLSLSKNDPGTYYYSIRADYGNYDYSDWYVDPPESGNVYIRVLPNSTKKAKLNIIFEPNSVPYSGEDNKWPFHMIITESNGVGVTLNSIKVEEYNQDGQIIYTNTWDEEWITNWFGSNYIPAFSLIEFLKTHGYMLDPEAGFAEYVKYLAKGTDDNGNQIEETAILDIQPQ
jgi:hypothetical protein